MLILFNDIVKTAYLWLEDVASFTGHRGRYLAEVAVLQAGQSSHCHKQACKVLQEQFTLLVITTQDNCNTLSIEAPLYNKPRFPNKISDDCLMRWSWSAAAKDDIVQVRYMQSSAQCRPASFIRDSMHTMMIYNAALGLFSHLFPATQQ